MAVSNWTRIRSDAHRGELVDWEESWDREVGGRRLYPARDATLIETESGPALTVPTPPRERVYVDASGFLYYPQLLDGQGPSEEVDTDVFLKRFSQLSDAEPEAILDYARRFGLLQVCDEHGLPFQHPPVGRKRERCWPAELEPLSMWREWSRRFRAVLAIRAQLSNGEPGRADDWRALGYSVPDDRSVGEARRRLARSVDSWLRWADNRTVFTWDPESDTPTIEVGCHGLFQCLTWELALTVARLDGLTVCEGCGEPYTRDGKDVKRVRKYCKACREAGVPARIRKRRQRAREEEEG